MGKKKIFLAVSGFLVLASIAVIAVFGFKQGIDFVGGTLWQVKVNATKEELKELLPDGAIVTPQPETESFLVRLQTLDDLEHKAMLSRLREKFVTVDELRFESIGPAIGGELRAKALTAFIFVLLAISLYIAFAFRKVSHPVSSWKYGLITLVTLFHDALIPAGMFAVMGKYLNAEIDTSFVVAILVVMGFSVHDTIVVFDRIRENLRLQKTLKYDFSALVNESVNQTFSRSINTSLTLVLVLLALYFLGAPSLEYFTLTILVGTVVGTYSSIFVASPLLTLWKK